MSLQWVLIASLLASAVAKAPEKSPQKGPKGAPQTFSPPAKKCDREAINLAFRKCNTMASKTAAECNNKMKAAVKSQCGVTIGATEDKKLKEGAARSALAACKMAGTSGCDQKFRNATGMTGGGTAKDRVQEKLDAARGAKTAAADLMTKCTKTKEACRSEMATSMKNLQGRNISKGELDRAMRDAGASAAGDAIKGCIANATTREERGACMVGSAATNAFAKASGRDPTKITKPELKNAGKMQAQRDVSDTLSACISVAANDATAQKACFKDNRLKDKIAGSQNMDANSVKDSRVHDYAMQATRKDMLTVIKDCNKTADRVQCKDVMKELKARSMHGKTKADITDNDLDLDARKAMKEDLATTMAACMEGSVTPQDRAACHSLAKDTIQKADMDGRMPAKGKVTKELRGAAHGTAAQTLKDCARSRDVCLGLVKDKISKVMGKNSASDVTTKDAEIFSKHGGLKAAADSASACVLAKKVDTNATCDSLYDNFKDSRKKPKPTSKSKENQEKSRMMVDTLAAMKKDMKEVCFEKASPADFDACMQSFAQETNDVANEFLRGNGTQNTAKVLDARKKRADRQATTSYLGDRFFACMKEATNNTERDACKTDMDSKMAVASVNASRTAVLKKFRAQAMAEAATACNPTERKACIDAAKEDMVSAGMKSRKFNMVKKLGEFISSAEVYASCKEADSSDADCEALAKENFGSVSGTPASVFDKVKARIVKLAQGIMNGDEIVMKKKAQILLDALTSGTSCDDNITTALLSKGTSVSVTPAWSGSKALACRLVDGLAEYSVQLGTKGFTEAQIETAADALDTGVNGATLGGVTRRLFLDEARRLGSVAVSSVSADQESEACAAGDATCGEDDTTTGISTTTGPARQGSLTSGEPARTGAGMLTMLALALMMP